MTIKIVVTQEKYNEIFSIDDMFYFSEISNKDVYEKMLQCVVGPDEKTYLSKDEARQEFKKIPRAEFDNYLREFITACGNALVNPTSGGG